nr:lipopolysaccharide biosynthesis protein [Oxynema sp. CENA135]
MVGVVWSAIENWGSQVISFLVFFILARLLDPQAFGLVALSSVFFAFLELFLNQGFANALIQKKHVDPEHLDTAFWINFSIALLLTLLGVFAAESVALWFEEPKLAPIIQWMSLSFLISAFSGVQQALFRRNLAFKALSARTLLATFVGGLVGIVMASTGFGVWSLVGQRLSNGVAGVLVLWWASDWRPGLKFSISHAKELFSFGVNIMGSQILTFFILRADDFLIGKFLGSEALGYYTIAYRVLLMITQLLYSTTNQVVLPAFSKLQEEPERLRKALYSSTQLSSLISLPLSVGIAVLAPELVVFLFGDKWMPSVPAMQILAFIGPLQLSQGISTTLLTAMGKPSWSLAINFINSITHVIGFLIAVQWGFIAVAAARVTCGYLVAPIRMLMVRKLLNIKLITYANQFTVALTASLAMGMAMYGIQYFLGSLLNSFSILLLSSAIALMIYPLVIWLMAPELLKQVLEMANSIISRKRANKKSG